MSLHFSSSVCRRVVCFLDLSCFSWYVVISPGGITSKTSQPMANISCSASSLVSLKIRLHLWQCIL